MMINLSKILRFYILLSVGTLVISTTASSATPDENAPQDIVTEETNLTNVEADTNAETDTNVETAIIVEIDRRVTELRNEFLDDKADSVNWWLESVSLWLAVIAIFFTIFALIVPIFSYFGYQKYEDSRKIIEKHVKDAEQHLDTIKKHKKEIADYTAGMPGKDNKPVTAPDTPEKDGSKVQEHTNDVEVLLPAKVDTKVLPVQEDRTANELRQTITKDMEESNPGTVASTWFYVGFLYQLEDSTTTNQLNNHNALDAYTQAIRLNPNYVEAYFNRGNANAYLSEHRKAIEDYDSAIQIILSSKSDYYKSTNTLHKLYFNSGNSCTQLRPPNYSNAIANYDLSLANTTSSNSYNHGIVYYNRGNAKFRIENYSDAAEDYRQATLCKRIMRDSLYNLGNAEVKLGDFNKASICYRESVELDANFRYASTNGRMVDNAHKQSKGGFFDMLPNRNTAHHELLFHGNSGSIGMYGGFSPPSETRPLPGGKGFPGDSGFLLDNQ